MSEILDSLTSPAYGIKASDPFGLETATSGKLQLQSFNAPEGSSPVMVNDKEGEPLPSSAKLVDKKVSISATYQSVELGAIGSIQFHAFFGTNNEIAIDTATITATAGQHLTVTINGHMHVGGSRTGHNATGARTVTVSGLYGFGAQYLTAECGVPEAALQSGSLQIQFNHTDEKDQHGNFLCGSTHGCTVTANYGAIDPESWDISTLTGDDWVATSIPTAATATAPGGTNGYGSQTNSSHQSSSLTVVKYFGKTGTNSRDVSITATHGSYTHNTASSGSDSGSGSGT